MAKSKLTLSPASLSGVFEVGESVVCIFDEVSHAAILAMCERLTWPASYAKGEEDDGLTIGQRAIDRLIDTMQLSDLITALSDINTTLDLIRSKIAGIDTNIWKIYTENMGPITADIDSVRIALETLASVDGWDQPDIERLIAALSVQQVDGFGTILPAGVVTYPTEAGGGDPLYGAATWDDADILKCQYSQWFVDEFASMLDYFISNTIQNIGGIAILQAGLAKVVGEASLPAQALLAVYDAILTALTSWASDTLDELEANHDDIVAALFAASQPDTAAALMADYLPSLPLAEIVLSYMTDMIFSGERRDGAALPDVSAYDGNICAYGVPGTWTVCTGLPVTEAYGVGVGFSTVPVGSDDIFTILFDVPVTIVEIQADDPLAFNYNDDPSATACGSQSWGNFKTADASGYLGNPSPGQKVRSFRVWRTGQPPWTGTLTVTP